MLLRCGGYQGQDSVHTRALRVLEAEIGRAGSASRSKLTPNITEQGRKASDLLTLVEGGELDLCYFSSSYLAGRVPSLRVLDLPFLVTDRERAYRALDGDLGKRLADDISTADRLSRAGVLGQRLPPLLQPAASDPPSARLPGHEDPHVGQCAASAGVSRAGLRPGHDRCERYAGRDRLGRRRRQENPLTNTVNFGLHRTHQHISLTSHFFGVALLLVNRAHFDGWSLDTRQLVRSAVATATRSQRGFAAGDDVDCLARLEGGGAAIVTADAIDRAAFESAVAAIRDAEAARIDPTLLRAL